MRFPEFADEWKQTTLGEILAFETGYPFPSDSFNGEGNGVRLIKNRDLKTDDRIIYYEGEYDERYIVQNGDILIGMDGDFSPCLWKKGKALLNQRVGRINTNQNASRVFILYVLADSLKEIELKTSSTTVKHLSHKDVEKIKASLPSLAEQQKIAGFLSLIDERIQSCSETIKERKREKAALLNQLFSQKLRFPQFSDEWQQTMLGEIAEILNSRRKPITSSDRVRGDYPYYGASGIIDYVNEYIFDEQLLLIGEDGAKWGKDEKTAFIVSGRCWVNNHAHVLRFQNYPTYKLIEAFFFSLNLKPFVTGDAPPKLTLENLKSILIHFPSLAEQEKIADFLSLIDERIEVEEELLEQYERQKRYLLKQMFI